MKRENAGYGHRASGMKETRSEWIVVRKWERGKRGKTYSRCLDSLELSHTDVVGHAECTHCRWRKVRVVCVVCLVSIASLVGLAISWIDKGSGFEAHRPALSGKAWKRVTSLRESFAVSHVQDRDVGLSDQPMRGDLISRDKLVLVWASVDSLVDWVRATRCARTNRLWAAL